MIVSWPKVPDDIITSKRLDGCFSLTRLRYMLVERNLSRARQECPFYKSGRARAPIPLSTKVLTTSVTTSSMFSLQPFSLPLLALRLLRQDQ